MVCNAYNFSRWEICEIFLLHLNEVFILFLLVLLVVHSFRQYKLPMASIIPFPKSNDPSSAPDFPPGKHVLAVYPGTTALYKATVVQGHRRVIIISLVDFSLVYKSLLVITFY